MLSISVVGADLTVKGAVVDQEDAIFVYERPYEEGDSILICTDEPCFVVAQPEDSISPVVGYLKDTFTLTIPFGEKKISYSPKNFSGESHLMRVRIATDEEIKRYRNLAYNPIDSHENTGLYPHAYANVETRGEAVFAARNAINGNVCSISHGAWPYESWGINRRDDAEITIDFGRDVVVDRSTVTLRVDFPHDNWWQEATLQFSDGSSETLHFQKTGKSQTQTFSPRTISSVTFCRMKKDPADPSPFPALTQLEIWGA